MQQNERYTNLMESHYAKLQILIPGFPEHIMPESAGESRVNAGRTLYFAAAGETVDLVPLIKLAHHHQDGDDVAPDPELLIAYGDNLAEPIAYYDRFVCKDVYSEYDGEPFTHLKNLKELNEFLSGWLDTLIEQGHRIDLCTQRAAEITQARGDAIEHARETHPTEKTTVPNR